MDEIADRFPGLLELLLAELAPEVTQKPQERLLPVGDAGQLLRTGADGQQLPAAEDEQLPSGLDGRLPAAEDGLLPAAEDEAAGLQPRVLVSAAVLPVLTILARLQRSQLSSSLQAGVIINTCTKEVMLSLFF